MGTRDYARILRRSWPMVVVGAIAGVAVALAVGLTTAPQYSATSAAFVSSERSASLTELTQGNAFTEKRVSTYARLASEPLVTRPVIDDFQLGITPGEFAKKMTVTIPVDTTMIEIAIRDSSGSGASSLANAVMTSLQTTVAEIETSTAAQTDANGKVIVEAAPPVKITQVRFAEVPTSPVSPDLPLYLLIGLVAGIALGVLGAILRDFFDSRVRSLADVEALTPIPIVGSIPQRPRGRSADDLTQGAGNAFDESIRILRTNLQFLDVDGPATFAITSATGGDGKSSITANLGVSIAATGMRVLVVDADLRRPRLHEYFAIEGGAGLTDVVIGRANLAEVVQPWRTPNLHVLAAGRIPPNPSELLSSAPMRELMDRARKQYDVVLYDCPPVLPVPDAAIVARRVGGTLVVISMDKSQREQIRGALSSLHRVKAHVSGIVANRVSQRGPVTYSAEEYHSLIAASDDGHEYATPEPDVEKNNRRAPRKSGLALHRRTDNAISGR